MALIFFFFKIRDTQHASDEFNNVVKADLITQEKKIIFEIILLRM